MATAGREVLRSLANEHELPDAVIDAILEYRNEDAPEEEGEEAAENLADESSLDVQDGLEPPKQIFATLADLENVPEFANLPDPKIKETILSMA